MQPTGVVLGLPKRLLPRLVMTAAVSWIAVRMGLVVLGTLRLTPLGAVALSGAVLGVAWLELRRNGEVLLYANLAVSPVRLSLVILIVTFLLEVAIGTPLSNLLPAAAAGSSS